ncbi:MAG TPA: hypothetical protein VFJ18_14875 [Pararhizobium sp.]|nr:hypothetical protein [Pararhizobium sp.]
MTETPAEELIRQIRETNTPDKSRYQRVKVLARQISEIIDEPQTASALNSAFRGAYMDLQLALLRSNDSALLDLYKRQCTKAVSRMCRAARENHLAHIRVTPSETHHHL